MEVRIFKTDTISSAADKIYKHFEVLQSCSIVGFHRDEDRMDLIEKGKAVFERICELDRLDNFEPHTAGKSRRKRRVFDNSNGAPEAHKIFRFKREFKENELRYTIWRMQ